MKRYSIIHVPVLCFFSKALYWDVCHEWKGTAFGYLLLLLAVCWIPPFARLNTSLSHFLKNEVPQIVSQVPVLAIADGKVSIEEPQPYYITDPKTGENVVVIDTTGKITSLEQANAYGLITETQAIVRKSSIETRTFNFSSIRQFTLSQEKIKGWLVTLAKIMIPILYPLALLASFIGRIVQVLIYAAIGILFASWCKSRRRYVELVRLSVVAITPCVIVRTILDAAGVNLTAAGLLFFLCAMGFLFFGVKSASKGESQPPALPVQ